MTEEQMDRYYDEAKARAAVDPTLATTLGVVMLTGFAFVETVEQFTGDRIENTYHTHFAMLDGREWEFTLRRKTPE